MRHSALILLTLGFCLFWLAGLWQVWLFCLLCALWHECGHLLAVWYYKGKVSRLRPEGGGLRLYYTHRRLSGYGSDILVSLAGPAANLLGALLCLVWHQADPFCAAADYLCGANMALLIINLLPDPKLDGGRALWSAVAFFRDPEAADRVIAATSLVCRIGLLAVGALALAWSGYNVSLLLVALCLLGGKKRLKASAL